MSLSKRINEMLAVPLWVVEGVKQLEAERDAMVAHVEKAKRLFEDAPEIDPHPHGVVLAVDIAAAQDWIDAAPATSLARLKAERQAEGIHRAVCVLESEFDPCHPIIERLEQIEAEDRRQAEEV